MLTVKTLGFDDVSAYEGRAEDGVGVVEGCLGDGTCRDERGEALWDAGYVGVGGGLRCEFHETWMGYCR